MGLAIGTLAPDAVRIGTASVDAIYVGTEKVWPIGGDPALESIVAGELVTVAHAEVAGDRVEVAARVEVIHGVTAGDRDVSKILVEVATWE